MNESGLVAYARSELEAAGLFEADSDYGGMLGDDILKIVRVFAKQGHSGMSASMVTSILERLLRFEPLSPLTGEEHEWNEVAPGVFQNRRCSRVFRENGIAYDIDGIVWRDDDGSTFTNYKSRVRVQFPYTPHTEVLPSKAAGGGGDE